MTERRQHYIPLYQRIQAAIMMKNRYQDGASVAEISKKTHISRSHLYSLEDKYSHNPSMEDNSRSGRPLKVTARTERRIVRSIEKDPSQSSVKMVKDINTAMDEEIQITARTFQRYAVRNGLFVRRPSQKPKLEAKHIKSRLEFALQYREKDMRFWRNFLFSDESYIELNPKDRQARVRRREGQRYRDCYILSTEKYGGGKILFWGSISLYGQGELIKLNGTLGWKELCQAP